MTLSATGALPTDAGADRLFVYRKDPFARLVARAFEQRPVRLFVVILLAGIICTYDLPLLNHTFWPSDAARYEPGFIVAGTDVYSQIVWLLLMPIAAVAYLRQLDIIPRMFNTLFQNGVTGLSQEEYRQFLAETDKEFNTWRWFVGNIVIFGSLWGFFVVQTARAGHHTWYFAPNIWPWVLYVAIQSIENVAGVSFPMRHYVAARRLKRLLASSSFHPQLLHPDGMCGCRPIVGFVLNGLVFGGTAFLILALQFANTTRSEPGFLSGFGVLIYIAAVLVYAFGVPYLLFQPLRMVIHNFREAKRGILVRLSKAANSAIWETLRGGSPADVNADPDQASASLLGTLGTFGESVSVVETIPQTLRDALFGARARYTALISTVLPPVTSVTVFVHDHWGQIDPILRGALPH